VWVYTALPELGANYGNPLSNNPSPPILAYKGGKGCRCFKEAILSHTRVINFVEKDIGEMFPKWEFDVEDTPAENIIKLMFVKKPWKWTMEHWEVTESSEQVHTVARSEVTTTVVDAMREGFGTCLKEIKETGTSSQNTTSPPKLTLEPGVKHVCFVYSVWILYIESVNGTNARRKRLPEDKGPDKEDARYQDKRDAALALCSAKSYNPFAPIDKKKLNELADWLKTCPHYRTALDKKPRTSRTWWYHILRTSLEWLEDCHIDAWINVLRKRYDANPQHFRSERMCFLDHLFAQQWRFNFKDFKDSELNQNGLGRKLPVNYSNTHWIAMWISIPKRNIVVFDSICSSISPEELDVVMEPFLYMVPYLLVECSSSDEQRAQYSLEPFTYERLDNILPARADFAKVNGKSTRDKMAVDIFQEHAHEFLNKDNDANLGAYEA
ncbi:unnamed protein product, partial [Brassica napus]